MKTPPSAHKLSLKEKLAFGAGQMNDLYMNNFIGTLINPVYNIALKLPLDLIGYASAIPRLWDAVSDPLVGSISDNFRSRWGRRKPFMVIGSLLAGLSLVGLWSVPASWGIWAMFCYLAILSVLFYTGSTLFLVPYSALGLAMSDDYNERTNLFAFRSLFDTVGGFLVPWSYFFVTLECFGSTVAGARVLSSIVAVGFLLFCAIPVFCCKERYDTRIAAQKKIPLVIGVAETVTNRPFMLLALSVMLMFFGMFTTGAIGQYLNIFYVFGGDERAASTIVGLSGNAWKLSSLISLPLMVWLARRIGKKETFTLAMGTAALAAAASWWCIDPALPYLQLIPPFLQGPAISCILLMTNSMMADVCDADELKNGARREAMFAAINGWLTKLGITGATALSGILLLRTGFDIELKADQAPQTIIWMRLLGAGLPALGMALAACLIWQYPLSRRIVDANKQALAERRGEG